jgi:phosphoenolpyruvate-protein phosphotransferase (PTS system enzyme I)
LHPEGVEARLPPLGMMVEVPAAALCASNFDADFMSIGSNDLVQYVMAAGRDISAVAALYDPINPAVLELIDRVVDSGRRNGIEVSLCGDMASDPALVPRLLELGLRRLSVAPATLGAVKAAIAGWGGAGRRPR